MSNRFKLIAGSHIEGGRQYDQGEIVVSSKELSKIFPNKFELLGPAQPERPPTLVTSPLSKPTAPVAKVQEPAEAVAGTKADTDDESDKDSDWDSTPPKTPPAPAAKASAAGKHKKK